MVEQGGKVSIDSFSYQVLTAPNPLRRFDRDQQFHESAVRVVPRIKVIDGQVQLGQMHENQAMFALQKTIRERLHAGEIIVIDDASHGVVFGMQSIKGRKLHTVEIHRYGKASSYIERTILRPKFSLQFRDSSWGREVRVSIRGLLNSGLSNAGGRGATEIVSLSSDGRFGGKAFTIAAVNGKGEQDLLFARVDKRESLSCAWAYEGALQWRIPLLLSSNLASDIIHSTEQ